MWLTRFTRLTVFASLALVLVFIFAQNTVKAQQDEGLRLSPAILDIPGKKGEATTTPVTLYNSSRQAIAVTADTRSLIPEDNLIDESAAERYRAKDWIKLPIKDFLIAPNESLDVVVIVDIPENAAPGGHYALVTFKIINSKVQDSTGVQVSPEAAAVVLMNVPGDIEESLDVHTLDAETFAFGSALSFSQTLKNHGNSHITPIVTTEIINRRDQVVDVITQPVQLLLPNTERDINIEWDSKGQLGKFKAVTKVSYGTPTKVITNTVNDLRVLPNFALLTVLFVVSMVVFNRFHTKMASNNSIATEQPSKSKKSKPKKNTDKKTTLKH